MIKISINGKTLDREFQNMAQALAFAYQNGECYGAKVVELAEGSVNKGWNGSDAGKPVSENHNVIEVVKDETAVTEPVKDSGTEKPDTSTDGDKPDPDKDVVEPPAEPVKK